MAPIVKSLPSYIKDSQHALEIFRDFNFFGQDKLIFTMDISSLYTVIPNSEGLLALKYFFDQRTVKEPSSETLLRLAEVVSTLNCFSFAGNYYKQINGVAMGTKMGPSYANLFVGYVEHQFFNQYDGPKPDFYGRYIDDWGNFRNFAGFSRYQSLYQWQRFTYQCSLQTHRFSQLFVAFIIPPIPCQKCHSLFSISQTPTSVQ